MSKIGIVLKPADGKLIAITTDTLQVNPPALDGSTFWLSQEHRPDILLHGWSCLGDIAGLSDVMDPDHARLVCASLQEIVPEGLLKPGQHFRKSMAGLIPGLYHMIEGLPHKWLNIIDRVNVKCDSYPVGMTSLELLDTNYFSALKLPMHTREKRTVPKPRAHHRDVPSLYQVVLDKERRPSPISALVGETCMVTNAQLRVIKRVFNCRLTDSLQFTGRDNKWLSLREHSALREVNRILRTLGRDTFSKRLLELVAVDLLCNNPINLQHPYGVFVRGQLWVKAFNVAASLQKDGHTVFKLDHRSVVGA